MSRRWVVAGASQRVRQPAPRHENGDCRDGQKVGRR
jgi:hypothetical protein